MRYVCQTLFDITATGVTGHFKATRIPFMDQAGQQIRDQESWNRSRNQQRNWETLTQILGLRTQLFDITLPIRDQSGTTWMFEFETETAGAFGPDSDPTQILRTDADGVPMILDLDNRRDLLPILQTQGANQNIWFAPISINNRL
jgi:hypothetical protein